MSAAAAADTPATSVPVISQTAPVERCAVAAIRPGAGAERAHDLSVRVEQLERGSAGAVNRA